MTAACTGRRGFLRAAGGLTVVLLPLAPLAAGCTLPVIPRRPAPDTDAALGWVRYEAGRATLCVPRVEMGQNILTALKQIACDELGLAWEQVDARLHGTASIGRVRATVGSESVRDFALPLARACATLRDALTAGQTQGRLQAVQHPVSALRSLRPGRSGLPSGPRGALEQGLAIVQGAPLYVADVRRPGMVFGRVLRAPASPELLALPSIAGEAAARATAGFVALVRDPLLAAGPSQGVGIVATTPAALDRIEQALALTWAVQAPFEQDAIDGAIDIDRRLAAAQRREHRVRSDAIDTAAPWHVDLRIDIPLAAHAAIEPRAAVAEFDAAGSALQLWVGSQDVFYQRDVIVRRLGLPESQVVVHGMRVGGAFGGKTLCTVELEAAVLARAAQAPVKVQWSRAQEFRQGFHRPPSSHRIRARLVDGRLDNWWHSFASSHILFTAAVLPPWLQRLTDVIGDDGVARGAALPYRAAAARIEFDLLRLPVQTGPWRGLGAGPNVFAIESAIDECARHAAADPVQFRLQHIGDPRLSGVLQQVAAWAAWEPRPAVPALPARQQGVQRGRGVACGIYKASSYAAVVADVVVDVASGQVSVQALWCVHDCGRVVNADQVRAQCEGNLVWGLGMVLVEGLVAAASQVQAASFADAPIPRLPQVPPLHVRLVDSDAAPGGAGETAIVAAGAAIANAVRDAVGVRPQRLPLQPGDLQALLRAARPTGPS